MTKHNPTSQDIIHYLTAAPFDKSVCQMTGPYVAAKPVIFFIVSSASCQPGLHPAKETIASEFIRQLANEALVKTIFIAATNSERSLAAALPEEAEQRLAEGALTGFQHAQSMLAATPLEVVRLDQPGSARQAGDGLKKWHAQKDRMLKALAILHTPLKRLIVHANKTIQTLLIRREAYLSNQTTLSDYARGLAQQAKAVGIELQTIPEFAKFYELVLQEKQIDPAKAQKEIALFGEHLLQTLGNKELWLRKTVEALSSAQTGQTQELETQIQFLTDYLAMSLNNRKLKESLFFRIALYGAHAEEFTELEKPLEQVSRKRREKAFFAGVLQGPMHILTLLTRKLLTTGLQRDTGIPETYDFVLDVGVFAGFDEAQIPNLIQQVQYGNHYRALVTPQLLKAIEKIENTVLKQASASDNDRAVGELYTTHTALLRRVQLQMEWGELLWQYISEPPQQNCADRIKQSRLMQPILSQEMQAALETLTIAESLAREYYRGREECSQGMAAILKNTLMEKQLDRALVYVREDHCKTLLTSLPPTASYIVLSPLAGTDRRKDPDFSHFNLLPAPSAQAEARIVFYKDIGESFKFAPRQRCENPLCRFTAPVIYDRIVCFTHPGSQAICYCHTCNKYYCGLELKAVPMSENDFERLLSFNPLELAATAKGKAPFSFQCRHCGEFVGKGTRALIWNINE